MADKKEYKWSVAPGGSVPLDSVALKTAMGEFHGILRAYAIFNIRGLMCSQSKGGVVQMQCSLIHSYALNHTQEDRIYI